MQVRGKSNNRAKRQFYMSFHKYYYFKKEIRFLSKVPIVKYIFQNVWLPTKMLITRNKYINGKDVT